MNTIVIEVLLRKTSFFICFFSSFFFILSHFNCNDCSNFEVVLGCLGVVLATSMDLSVSHDPYFKNMIFLYTHSIPFTLKIKYHSPLQGKRSMFLHYPYTI